MKLKLFQKFLSRSRIPLTFLITPDPHLGYFTQQVFSFAFLLITPKKVNLLISKLDKKPTFKGIEAQFLEKGWEKKLVDKKIRKVGINESSLTIGWLKKLKKVYPHAKFVDVSKKLKRLRDQKTDQEIKKIKQATKTTCFAFNELIKELKKKPRQLKTEKAVAQFLEKKIKEKGAELAFPIIVASGKNSAIPHHQTSTRQLKNGFLLIDLGAKYKGYGADMTRTLYLGAPRLKEKDNYHLLLRIQQEAFNQVKKGKLCKTLDKFVRNQLGQKSSYFIHSLGHGVGLEVHESPQLSSQSKDKFSHHQVFTLEPGIYFPNQYGIRIEDTVLLEKGGPNVLTKSSKKLILLPSL